MDSNAGYCVQCNSSSLLAYLKIDQFPVLCMFAHHCLPLPVMLRPHLLLTSKQLIFSLCQILLKKKHSLSFLIRFSRLFADTRSQPFFSLLYTFLFTFTSLQEIFINRLLIERLKKTAFRCNMRRKNVSLVFKRKVTCRAHNCLLICIE